MKKLIITGSVFSLLAILCLCLGIAMDWFWLSFIGLSVVYVDIFLLIIWGIMTYYDGGNYHDYLWNKDYNSNNNWFYALIGATIVTFVIALFNFGPAVMLPSGPPLPKHWGDAGNVLQHILYGNDATKMGMKPVKDILPWATGTWFWWKAFGLYILLTIGYIPFAFYDEVVATYHFIKEEIRKHHDAALAKKRVEHSTLVGKIQAINAKRKKDAPETPLPKAPPDKLHFEEFMEIGVVIEILLSVIKFIKEMKEA